MAGTRFFISGVVLYAAARLTGAGRPTRAQWGFSALVGALLLLGGNGGVAWAEQTVPTGLASILIATVPIWMTIFDWAMRGPKPGRAVAFGILLGFCGTYFLVNPSAGRMNPVGALVLLGAAVSWALGSILSRRLALPASPILSVGMQMVGGSAFLYAASALAGEPARFDPASVTAGSLWALAYLILFGSFLGFTAYVWLLRVSSVARVSTYAYVNPVVAMLLGHFTLGERFSRSDLAAAGVILSGVILIQSRAPEA